MENNKRTQCEWTALEIGKNEWVIKEKYLPNGYSDRIAELYQYNAKANAEFICEAVNNYDKLKEDNALLLDALKDAQLTISNLILAIPTGETRNTLSYANIKALQAIHKSESK